MTYIPLLFQEAYIIPLSPEGRVTVAILQFNLPERVRERQKVLQKGIV